MLLQARGRMTARELAQELEVSERTIYRDLDALSAAGIPVYAERGPGGGCALLDSYRTNLTGLTEDEVRALFMVSVPSALADLGVSQELKSALLKLAAAVPAVYRRSAQHVRQRIHMDATGWFQPPEQIPHLPAIQEAVWQDCKLALTYRRGDGTHVERLVEPYGLVAKAGVWYLVRTVKGHLGVYRISRVQDATLTGERFERRPGFDLATFWAEWCAEFEASRPRYPVTLSVAPGLVPQLWPWAEPKESESSEGVEGWVTMSITFETLEMARRHVLNMGAMVRVLEPQELRDSLLDLATRIVALYA
jgi:predicted DNA-binding transcriptional regulator YafY